VSPTVLRLLDVRRWKWGIIGEGLAAWGPSSPPTRGSGSAVSSPSGPLGSLQHSQTRPPSWWGTPPLPASRWPPNGFHVDPYYFVHYRILYVYVVQPKSGGLSSQIYKWDWCPCPHARLRRLWQLVRELSRGVKRLASAPALQPLASDCMGPGSLPRP